MSYKFKKSFTHIILESILYLLTTISMIILIVVLLSTFYLAMKKVEKMTKIKTISIKCYSGNTLIYEGKSKAISNVKSNSYEFIELGTNNSMEISGNCIIKYDN